MTERLTREAILASYSEEPDFLENLLKLQTLSDFLQRCVVDDDYEVPHRLANEIRLTSAGNALLKRMQNNANPRNYCIVALFLELWWRELFVDPIATDTEALREAISEEIRKDRILYPYTYGRVVYDKAFEEYPDSREVLPHKETLALLRSTQQGVFQLDQFVSGPWGLLNSRARRYAPPTHSIPLYHCSEFSCSVFHRTQLTTGRSRISKVSTRLHEMLDKRREVLSDWAEVIADQVDKNANPFSWQHTADLPRFLGDAFSLRELKAILADLLDHTSGKLRGDLAAIGESVRGASDFVSDLSEAQCIQLILLCADIDIIDSIDTLVLSGSLSIPLAEVRTTVDGHGGGYFRLEPECSGLGVRFDGGNHLALLRVRHLLSKLFDMTNPTQRERLAWLIRMTEGESLHEQLERYLSEQDLDEVVRAIVFDSRANVEDSKRFVGIGPRASEHLATEESMAEAIIWRLGIGDAPYNPALRDFHAHGREFRESILRSHDYSTDEQDAIRGVAANFFVKLEELLCGYLCLATWALCRDHYGSSEGFVYSSAEALGFSRTILGTTSACPDDGKWTLGPLCRGFAALADFLEELTSKPDHVRPSDQAPLLLQRNEGPHSFLFKNRYPFLDLSAESKGTIVKLLREASSKLGKGKVDYVRNQLQHANPFPDQSTMATAITAAEAVIAEGEEAGMLPVVSRVLGEQRDSFGRRRVTIGTARGKTAILIRPSQHFLAGFPPLSSPQYVIRSAIFDGSSEPLRLSIVDESEYATSWKGFPRRRRVTLSTEADRTAAVPQD